ncbi:MAG: isochorismatase family protein [Polyangiaceae bacterium]
MTTRIERGTLLRVRLEPARTTVAVVDVQEKLAKAMDEAAVADLLRATTVLLEAARLLGARVVATEQYPEGLGPTIGGVREKLVEMKAPILSKLAFAATDAEGFQAALGDARSVVVVGMETHVCVYQTVRELALRGVDVHVAIDGVASRRADHKAAGIELMRACGASITTMETVVFDWLRRAGTSEFKALSKLIR